MPQPLSMYDRSNKPRAFIVGDLSKRPALALLMIETLHSWTVVEQSMLQMFVEMMGGDKSLATIAYLAIETSKAKHAVINAMASERLDKLHLQTFEAIIRNVKSNQKFRDKIAHWVWHYSDDFTDVLFAQDPREWHKTQSVDSVYVFNEKDFRNMIDSNKKLQSYCFHFRLVLSGAPVINAVTHQDVRTALGVPDLPESAVGS